MKNADDKRNATEEKCMKTNEDKKRKTIERNTIN